MLLGYFPDGPQQLLRFATFGRKRGSIARDRGGAKKAAGWLSLRIG
jgi:hypothetical protein